MFPYDWGAIARYQHRGETVTYKLFTLLPCFYATQPRFRDYIGNVIRERFRNNTPYEFLRKRPGNKTSHGLRRVALVLKFR